MVPVLVVLTFAALVALDHFVFSKGYLEEKSGWPPNLEILPASAAHERVPKGVYLQPTFTWSRVGEWGGVYVGVHPLLLGLVGESCAIGLRAAGERVSKGEPLVRLTRSGRELTVCSPISGRVERVNGRAAAPVPREVPARDGPWLYRLRPERDVAPGTLGLAGEAALEWTRRQYHLLCNYLQGAVTAGHLGMVMADGGELPAGILADLEPSVWRGLEERFLAPEGTATGWPEGRPHEEGRA